MDDKLIDAYLRERKGYLARGLPEKVAHVDAELARLGYEIATVEPLEPPASAVPETTSLQAPPEQAIPPRPQPRKRDTRYAP